MRKLASYLRSATHNIYYNKTYALFYIAGTAITFIFIIIVLQISHLIQYAAPPFTNVARTIHISEFCDYRGEDIGGIEVQDIDNLIATTYGADSYSISNIESVNADINGKIRPINANFVNVAYFNINEFNFISGQAFSADIDAAQQAIITKDLAINYYQNEALGKKIEIQGIKYTVIGVVDNYSSLLNPHEQANVWLPCKYNKFVPSGGSFYAIDILFRENMSTIEMKNNLSHALTQYFSSKGQDINLGSNTLLTIQEDKEKLLGGGKLIYGVVIIIFLLLAIPAINIMTLSMANVYNRATEIAIRRALGADKMASFTQIIVENLILVFVGLIIALILIFPTFKIIERIFFTISYSSSFLTSSSISWTVILLTILLAILYTILSGGIPAYSISNKNIVNTLKGEVQ